MSSAFTIMPLLLLLTYGVMLVLVVLVIYALLLAIKALRIYIQKNS